MIGGSHTSAVLVVVRGLTADADLHADVDALIERLAPLSALILR